MYINLKMIFNKLLLTLIFCHLISELKLSASTSFTYSGTCQNEKTKFTNTSNWGNKYLWRFGDGNISSNRDPEYTFTEAGLYNVTLIVSKDTITDSTSQQIIIYSTVFTENDIYINDNLGCYPIETTFGDTSIFTISRDWEFSDGSTYNDSLINHWFNTPGYYTISLTTQTSQGCTRTGTFDSLVHAYPVPVAEFTIDPVNPTSYNKIIRFVNKTEGEKITDWRWELGDGALSYEEKPVHEYDSAGEYRIQLTAKNAYSCSHSVEHTIFISDRSSWYIPRAFSPNGDGINDDFLPVTHNMETKEFEFYVYDKWGNLVFQSKDIESSWNGRSYKNQQMLPTGVYTWQMKIIYESGVELKKIGFINLLSENKK
jgi:gliding motility-associated-like protein